MTVHQGHTARLGEERGKPVRTIATVVGAVFVLVGIAGFVPGLTTGYDDLQLAGHESEAQLLGVFQVSILHNIAHLALGVVGLAMARRTSSAVAYLVGGGLVYLALWVWGLAVDPHSDANLIPLDDADNWLHLGLGLGMVVLGLAGQRAARGNATGEGGLA
jgi:hypothetical protein